MPALPSCCANKSNRMPEDFFDLEKLKARDEAAWLRAFRPLFQIAAQAVRAVAGLSNEEIEDIAFEAVHATSLGIDKVKSEDHLPWFIRSIAFKKAVDHRRRQRAAKRGAEVTASLDALREQGKECCDPAESLLERLSVMELAELLGLLEQAMADMKERDRAFVRAHYLEGRAITDLAREHRLPEGTVGAAISRGLRKVRIALRQNPQLLQRLKDYLR